MDALFLRHLIRAFSSLVPGLRLGKFFHPGRDLWSIDLGRPGHLVLCLARGKECLFLSAMKMENPPQPSAQAMWLRKRFSGRCVSRVHSHWPARRMALEFSGSELRFLVLDLKTGFSSPDVLPSGFDHEPVWPEFDAIFTEERIWESHPQITPRLRRTLRRLVETGQRPAAEQVYASVRREEPEGFYLCQGCRADGPLLWDSGHGPCRRFDFALEAAEAYGLPLAVSCMESRVFEQERISRENRSLRRALARLEQDETRLRDMIEGERRADLLKANLYALDPRERTEVVRVSDVEGNAVEIPLDPKLTIQENMARLYRRAAKGRRGLGIVEQRRRDLRSGRAGVKIAPRQRKKSAKTPDISARDRYAGAQVATYKTGEGFLVLRGKNQKANHRLLSRLCSPFDFWFHAEGGPGAHVILKRDHALEDIPDTSLQEAAVLAGLYSHQAHESKARVICALVRDVRKIKGAALGHVAVDQVYKALTVALDPAVEVRMRRNQELGGQ